jgi:hypothetical protein
MLAAFSASVLAGPTSPPVMSYDTAEKKLGIRTSEKRTAMTHAMMIQRWRLWINLFRESKSDFDNYINPIKSKLPASIESNSHSICVLLRLS